MENKISFDSPGNLNKTPNYLPLVWGQIKSMSTQTVVVRLLCSFNWKPSHNQPLSCPYNWWKYIKIAHTNSASFAPRDNAHGNLVCQQGDSRAFPKSKTRLTAYPNRSGQWEATSVWSRVNASFWIWGNPGNPRVDKSGCDGDYPWRQKMPELSVRFGWISTSYMDKTAVGCD